ncbi:hypothetical protein Dtox_2460 [Desulfofarcimen acetoxidans DSM 771]|uniref:Uncharacterized protein n=1 Tax=Desulfofarcimen acetoxidans (strain ATCC 49208 / DSM 771 / KCTC 5769 / VKM B-1644 / 5575) TaxID=485916 RepID=C8W0L4_DESAS|nr:hypothetical protein [Desulfofarcimen acetoxidans]ACV63269.1 hypothetical protein Dtox_2460 [Desulfofarcimen acetoxidans DSM 771]
MRVKPVSEYMLIGKVCPYRKIRVPVEWESITGQAIAEEFLACYGDECMMWDGNGCSLCRVGMPVTLMATEPAEQTQKQHQEIKKNQDGKVSGCKDQRELKATVTVLEAKETKTGSIRAWCEKDNRKEVVFAKNGAGKVLLNAIGKQVEIKYCLLENDNGSKIIFAVKATVLKS